MLGMMNCSSDQIEFYAANTADRKYTSQYSQEQTKAFTEVKHRPQISYTQGEFDSCFPSKLFFFRRAAVD